MCPSKEIDSVPSQAREQLDSYREQLVSRYPPSTREEFAAWGAYWPLNYRPRHTESPRESVAQDEWIKFESKRDIVASEDDLMFTVTGVRGLGAVLVNPKNDQVYICKAPL